MKSITRAAAKSGISQSAASQQLQELERRIGTDLLDRSTRPARPTEAGRFYYQLCRDVLKAEATFLKRLEEIQTTVTGDVRVASIYSIGLSEMTRAQDEFAKRHPAATLHVEYARPSAITHMLRTEQVDLGLISYPEPNKELAVISWREEEMVVAASPWHALAQTNVLVPSDLEDQDFIGFDHDLAIRREVDRFFREQGVAIRVVMHFDNIQTVKEAVALGRGISLLPACTMRAEIEQGRLVAVPLLAPGLRRPIGILHRKGRRMTRAVRAFADLLLELPAPELPPPPAVPIPPSKTIRHVRA